MPTVPYSPVPSISPNPGQGTPSLSVNAPSEAFGGNIAAAIGGLGRAVDKAGDEIYARGAAMQDLFNHSEAQQADADFMEKVGGIKAQYDTLQGKAAVDAYPKYITNLKQLREQSAAALSNPMSQKLFDSSSRSMVSRSIFSGAGHAATENKKFALGSSSAKVSAIANDALQSPQDEDGFRAGLTQTETEVREQGVLMGTSPEETSEMISNAKSKLWTSRIGGLSKSEPFKASKMLDDAAKRGEIRGEDLAKITNQVRQSMYTVGSRNVSQEVLTGAGNRPGFGTVDIKLAREAIGQIESGGRYDLQGVQTKHGRALGKYQVMEEYLPEYLANAGLPSMTPAEYLKSPSIQDQVFDANFSQKMKAGGSANDAASMWLTGRTLNDLKNTAADAHGTNAQEYVRRFNKALAERMPLADKIEGARAIAAERAPNDPMFQDYAVNRVESDNNRLLQVKRDTDYYNKQTVEGALIGGPSGKLPTTLEEVKSDPDSAAAWDNLPASDQRRYLGVLARNAKGDTSWTEEKLRNYQRIKGQAASDPAGFLEMDVISTDLPTSARKELIGLQGKMKEKAESDPRVTKALQVLGPDLQAAGITRQNKDEYDQYVGALQEALTDWQEEHKKAPNAAEVKVIGARLMQERSGTGWFGTNIGVSKVFNIPVPEKEAEAIKALPTWAEVGITPTDTQIQRIYTRKVYNELYGGKPTKPSSPTGPKPPVSQ